MRYDGMPVIHDMTSSTTTASEYSVKTRHPYQCLKCGHDQLLEGRHGLLCPACTKRYPVLFGVPMLVRKFSRTGSGFELSEKAARAICEYMRLEPHEQHLEVLEEILSYDYDLLDAALTAENNYFLNRVGVSPADLRAPAAKRQSAAGVNLGVRYAIERHYVPEVLPARQDVTYNVRLNNQGDSIISSRGSTPAYLSYQWRDEQGRLLEANGARTPLPIDLLPGRSLTVPMAIRTPWLPWLLRRKLVLEIKVVVEGVEWIDAGACRHGVRLSRRPAQLPDHWQQRDHRFADYAADHLAGREMISRRFQKQQVEPRRILEIGGCCHPMTRDLAADLYSVDIDVQTLQIGHLKSRQDPDNIHFVCADAGELPFRDAAFDCVAIFAALHHFADPRTVLARLGRLVRPGGFVAVMCEPVHHYVNGEVDANFIRELEQGINEQTFSMDEYRTMFEQSGLQAREVVIDTDSLKAVLTAA